MALILSYEIVKYFILSENDKFHLQRRRLWQNRTSVLDVWLGFNAIVMLMLEVVASFHMPDHLAQLLHCFFHHSIEISLNRQIGETDIWRQWCNSIENSCKLRIIWWNFYKSSLQIVNTHFGKKKNVYFHISKSNELRDTCTVKFW